MSDEERILNEQFENFKANFASFKANFPNVTDFQKKMLIKGQIVAQTSDFLSAVIYFSMALWSYALTGDSDKASINALQNLIITNRQKLKSSLVGQQDEDTPLYTPEKEEDMINKITGTKLNFDTLAGAITEKEMIKSKFVYPILYNFLYLTEDNNVLLYGPPGTGKTLLAKACVGELNKDTSKIQFLFYNLSADSVRSKWEGGTEKNIAAMFKTASDEASKKQKELRVSLNPDIVVKSILFLDEVEAIAKARDQGGDERSVTTLLQQMDGFKSAGNVLVIAATNFPWVLDSAFLRRFTARVFVDLPDFPARIELIADTIFSKYIKSTEEKSRLLSLLVLAGPSDEEGEMSSFSKKFKNYTFELKNTPVDANIKNFIDNCYKQSGNFLNFGEDEIKKDYHKKYACYLAKKIYDITNISSNISSAWKDSQRSNLSVFAKFVFFLADLTGPNSNTKLNSEELIRNRRTSPLGLSKYGHSPSDITKIIAEFFSITAHQIITSCFESESNMNVCNKSGFQASKGNCYKSLIDQGVIYPCKEDKQRFSLVQKPASKTKKFVRNVNGEMVDVYTVLIPDLMREALLTYITTTGNADYYCNLLEYSRTAESSPNLGESCKKINIGNIDFM